MKPHTQARTEANTHYKGRRVKVADKLVPWSKEATSYLPGEFTDNSVLREFSAKGVAEGWADPPTPQEVTDLRQRKSYEAPINFDDAGMPLNPRGRTGLRGRGLLGKWGPNHAADPIVTRHSPLTGVLQVLCILRKDTDQWALPGGIVRAGESVSVTVRKGIQECGNFKQKSKKTEEFKLLVDGLFSRGVPVFMGYADDPRNTDHAWMESKVMHFHCSAELGSLLPLKAEGAKAGAVVWLDTDSAIEPRYGRLYGSHMQWVEQALAPAAREGPQPSPSPLTAHHSPFTLTLTSTLTLTLPLILTRRWPLCVRRRLRRSTSWVCRRRQRSSARPPPWRRSMSRS